MSDWILVVDSDNQSCLALADLLRVYKYRAVCSPTLNDVESVIQKTGCRVAIFDLDSILLNDRTLKQFKKLNADLYILALSERPFHPELKESMTKYIYACLNKPLDPDELVYCVKSIFCNASSSGGNPAQNNGKH